MWRACRRMDEATGLQGWYQCHRDALPSIRIQEVKHAEVKPLKLPGVARKAKNTIKQ